MNAQLPVTRRAVLRHAALLGSTLLLSACASGAAAAVKASTTGTSSVGTAATRSTRTPAASTPAATVSFELWDNNHFDVEQSMLQQFEKSYPTIKISVRHTVSNYLTKLETEIAGGVAPDVFWLSTSFFPEMAIKHTVASLSGYIARDKVNMADYGKQYVAYFTYQSKLFGFPKDWDTVALLYNKDLFDAAGVAYPTAKWTWDPSGGGELLQAAQKLTKGSGTNAQYGFLGSPTAGQTFWWNFVWMNGGDILDGPWGKHVVLDTPQAIDALQFCANLAVKYRVSPSYGTLTGQPADRIFWLGRAAMITNGDWVLHNYSKQIGSRFHWDIALLPSGPKGRISETNSLAYGLSASSKQPDAAWTFIKWLGREGEIMLAKGGATFPAYLPAVDDFVKAFPSFNMQAYAAVRANAHPVPETPYATELGTTLGNELEPVWNGRATVEAAVQKIVSKMDAILAATPSRA